MSSGQRNAAGLSRRECRKVVRETIRGEAGAEASQSGGGTARIHHQRAIELLRARQMDLHPAALTILMDPVDPDLPCFLAGRDDLTVERGEEFVGRGNVEEMIRLVAGDGGLTIRRHGYHEESNS